MEIKDRIYGKEKIKEGVLLELICSPSIQRLKNVTQTGMPEEYYHKKVYSRFEHSLGVLILLRKLKAGLEEQIAGLAHDVSHTAFSHVVDWVLGDPTKENYQDQNLLKMIENSEIPGILKKYDFDYRTISNPNNFSLLEREAPSLCADRIDYTLRELALDKNFKIPRRIFNNLFVKNNQIVFKSKKIAELFAKEYSSMQSAHWGGDEARARYYILSQILDKGLQNKFISLDDLNKTDCHVLDILENSNDKFIIDKLNLLKNGFRIMESNNGIKLRKKFRYIDPEISFNDSYKSLSFFSKDYANFLQTEKEKSKLVKKIKIIPT